MLPEVQGKEHLKTSQLVRYMIFEWHEVLGLHSHKPSHIYTM